MLVTLDCNSRKIEEGDRVEDAAFPDNAGIAMRVIRSSGDVLVVWDDGTEAVVPARTLDGSR